MSNHRQIEQVAATWLARRDREDWSEADDAGLSTWLSTSIAHRVAFLRLETAWRKTGRLKALAAGLPAGAVPRLGQWSHSPFFSHRSGASAPEERVLGHPATDAVTEYRARLLAEARAGVTARPGMLALRRALPSAAAAVLLTTVIGLGWIGWPHDSSYQTAVGHVEAVPIQDGSTVTLNTDSGIRVAVTETERRVDLEKGEAFFEVAKDPKRPFVVRAGAARIIAVGTKFSVRREADNVRVIVTEGRVRVEHAGPRQLAQTTLISAGSVALAGESGVLVEDQALADVEDRLSWRHGFVIFHETPLADAVAEFNRYNTRQIVIANRALESIRIGGTFRPGNAEAFVRLLSKGFPIQVEESEDRIILSHQ